MKTFLIFINLYLLIFTRFDIKNVLSVPNLMNSDDSTKKYMG